MSQKPLKTHRILDSKQCCILQVCWQHTDGSYIREINAKNLWQHELASFQPHPASWVAWIKWGSSDALEIVRVHWNYSKTRIFFCIRFFMSYFHSFEHHSYQLWKLSFDSFVAEICWESDKWAHLKCQLDFQIPKKSSTLATKGWSENLNVCLHIFLQICLIILSFFGCPIVWLLILMMANKTIAKDNRFSLVS